MLGHEAHGGRGYIRQRQTLAIGEHRQRHEQRQRVTEAEGEQDERRRCTGGPAARVRARSSSAARAPGHPATDRPVAEEIPQRDQHIVHAELGPRTSERETITYGDSEMNTRNVAYTTASAARSPNTGTPQQLPAVATISCGRGGGDRRPTSSPASPTRRLRHESTGQPARRRSPASPSPRPGSRHRGASALPMIRPS